MPDLPAPSDHVALVQENDDVRYAYLSRQQDVLSRLRHRSVCCSNNQDCTVHLRSTGDHVLNVVSVPRAVYVCVVSVRCFILYVSGGNGDTSFLLFRSLIDLIECYVSTQSVSLVQNCSDSSSQCCLTVVNVADCVSVVLPWSTWPIVPMLICGFVLSNFCLAISNFSLLKYTHQTKKLELLSGLEPPNLFLTKEVLYLLSYNSPTY